MSDDLTIVYYTANVIPEDFMRRVQSQLTLAAWDYPIISVSKKPIDFGQNIVVNTPRSHISIYRDALTGARAAKTKYIAMAEDDCLYSPDHFAIRPSRSGVFTYNQAQWSIYTWVKPPMFTYKGRRNMYALICERDVFIEAMEERFNRWPNEADINLSNWAEPGKYERQLGVTPRESEFQQSGIPLVVFSHETALGYAGLGRRKRVGTMRAYDVPYWGRADNIIKRYSEEL